MYMKRSGKDVNIKKLISVHELKCNLEKKNVKNIYIKIRNCVHDIIITINVQEICRYIRINTVILFSHRYGYLEW